MCTGFEIAAAASAVKGVGGLIQAQGIAGQREERGQQIASSAIQGMRQKAVALGRRRSAQEAAFGKAGVRMTGSAKQVLEEQIRQDELELLTDKYNAELAVKEEFAQAKEARTKGFTSLIGGAVGAGKAYATGNLDAARLGLGG